MLPAVLVALAAAAVAAAAAVRPGAAGLAAAVGLLAASGLAALPFPRAPRRAHLVAAAVAALGAAAGAGTALGVLAGRGPVAAAAAWAVPFGALRVGVDPLSAVFLLAISLVAGLGSAYGVRYFPLADHGGRGARLLVAYGVTAAAMALLVAARNGMLFLAAWEVMALGGFTLVVTEDHHAEAREAGLVYIVTTHAATLALFVAFALLRARSGSLDFDRLAGGAPSRLDAAVFVLALVAFGSKAGLAPLHFWLPGAHAAAPSHVSALMSGVLIKMGIYGLLRATTFFAAPPAWYGGAVLALGVASGVLGVAFALGQHDLKRLLAYHSIENVGIITMGAGLALLGRALGAPRLAALGAAGALLHVLNHALFKPLLFLGAGSVLRATGTRAIDRLGGLARRQPWTAGLFVLGAVAIAGLPPLNGFVSELYVYLALLEGAGGAGRAAVACALGVPCLALIGALAVACFVKVVGAVFLGEPRTPAAADAREAPAAMLLPMGALALACAAIGLAPGATAAPLARAAAVVAGAAPDPATLAVGATLAGVTRAAAALGLLLAALAGLRAWLLRGRAVTAGPTWDCGYARPTPRMQYTAASFAEILVGILAPVLRPRAHAERPEGLTPRRASFESHVPDLVLDRVLLPAGRLVRAVVQARRRLQHGRLQLYVLSVLATLVALLAWRAVGGG